ncbi:MAG: N-acetyltransferase family protein [Bacteroidia bacterium]
MPFIIRPARPGDEADIADIYRPVVENTAISFELEPPDADEMRRRIELTEVTHLWLVCENEGRTVAYAYGGTHRSRKAYQWSTEVSVYVGQNFRGRGIARALYDVLLKGLELQGFVTALAGITIPNAESEAFHRAMGFQPFATYKNIGYKMGQWHSVIWLRRELRSADSAPPPLKHYTTILNLPEWKTAIEHAVQRINHPSQSL